AIASSAAEAGAPGLRFGPPAGLSSEPPLLVVDGQLVPVSGVTGPIAVPPSLASGLNPLLPGQPATGPASVLFANASSTTFESMSNTTPGNARATSGTDAEGTASGLTEIGSAQ